MKFYFLLAAFFFLTHVTFTQTINIKVKNSEDERALLSSLQGEKLSTVDSIFSDSEGEFHFSLEDKHAGFYRLQFSKNKSLDFVYDNEDVEIEADANNILENLKVSKSESNKIYYNFIKLNKEYKTKTELLQLILARYPKDDDYFQTSKEKLIQVQEDYLNFVNETAQANPNSFIARYVRSAQLPVVDSAIPFDKQLTYLKSHALDNVNFYDDGMIYSDAFTNKTIEYLTYYRNPQLPLELLEKEFMSAIDTILSKAKVNEIVYKHIVEYLIDGFKQFGFDNVIDHTVENYVIKDELCLDDKLESSVERRIQQSKNFKIGSTVPDIIISDSIGKQIGLNDISSERILILFYASWCTHCQSLISQLGELYRDQKEKKTEILAVSIDTSKTDLIVFVKSNNMNWINYSDLQGWNGKAATDYFLYATPTMFLIDKEKRIILKPSSIEELSNWF